MNKYTFKKIEKILKFFRNTPFSLSFQSFDTEKNTIYFHSNNSDFYFSLDLKSSQFFITDNTINSEKINNFMYYIENEKTDYITNAICKIFVMYFEKIEL